MFLFLRSQLCSGPAKLRLRNGWTEPLPHNWTRTEKTFSFEVTFEEPRRPGSFLLGFVVPDSIAKVSPVTLHFMSTATTPAQTSTRATATRYFEKQIPAAVDHQKPMLFEFSVEHSFDPRPDPRELGIIMPFTGAIRGTDSSILFWLD